mmetsp:Transcript_788/g.1113  ORF Transcript_788/g.1113 Transcript_788/m.1113 type:complete len:142 (+) Transcript_788:1863-2288(+)
MMIHGALQKKKLHSLVVLMMSLKMMMMMIPSSRNNILPHPKRYVNLEKKMQVSSMRERTSYLDVSRCLMQRSFLSVTPCDTNEHEALHSNNENSSLRPDSFSGSRNSMTRAMSNFNDKKYLFKNAGFLGAIELSVFSMGRF